MKKTESKTRMTRLPPHSIEAEEQLLSSIFIDGVETMTKALDAKVCAESFYVPANRTIWEYLNKMLKLGIDIDTSTIAEEMKKDGVLEDNGGYSYLARVSACVQTTARVSYFIDKVQELYTLRRLLLAGTKVVEDVYSHTGDFAVFAMQVEEALRIREGLEKPKTLASACDDTIALLERYAKGEKPSGYPWPWSKGDEILDMVEPGELVTIGARPSRGKSSVARQIAWHWSEKIGDVAFFSREMPVGQLPQLFAQSLCGVSWREARKGYLHPKDLSVLTETIRNCKKNTKLHIFDKDSTVSQICARIKAMRQTKEIKAVFVDYLQAYDMEQQKGETRDVAIGRFTRALKDIALDLNIPVILLAQLSRSVEREEREPRASDLRESGNTEQDSDRVMFVHWLPVDRGGIAQDFQDYSRTTIAAQLIQVKNRNGSNARLDVDFYRPTTTFMD